MDIVAWTYIEIKSAVLLTSVELGVPFLPGTTVA